MLVMERSPNEQSRAAGQVHIPRILYTYRTINDHLRDTLIKRQIWVSNPLSFNDPFDCNLPMQKRSTPEEAKSCVESLLQRGGYSEEFQLKARRAAERGEIINPHKITEGWEKTMREAGVACFSEIPNDILMWSHYASKHEGVCLGFEDLPSRLDVRPVQYRQSMPEIRIADFLSKLSWEQLKVLLLTKSCQWAYEREWRFVHGERKFSSDNDPARGIPFFPDELRRVIFGCRVSAERRHEIILLLKSWPTKIHFYQAHTHDSRFALRISRLND
jgi:hypothetical protein